MHQLQFKLRHAENWRWKEQREAWYPDNGVKWFGLHPKSWEVTEGCFVICIFHFGYSRACWVEGGGSKRAGHLPWGTVGDLRMRRSQEESLWGTRWAGGLEQQLLGQRWVSEICIMRHHRGHAPRDVVKHCTGLVVGQYVPCLNWTGLNWVELGCLNWTENADKSREQKLRKQTLDDPSFSSQSKVSSSPVDFMYLLFILWNPKPGREANYFPVAQNQKVRVGRGKDTQLSCYFVTFRRPGISVPRVRGELNTGPGRKGGGDLPLEVVVGTSGPTCL